MLCLWLVASPFILGFQLGAATVNVVLSGIVVLVLVAVQALDEVRATEAERILSAHDADHIAAAPAAPAPSGTPAPPAR